MQTILTGVSGELVEKKSRFIANIEPVRTEEEALSFIAEMKKKYYDARHNCYCYIVGENGQIKKSSDDGEPSGTAGKPMLEILEKKEIVGVVAVVTRYFGGTLLGTGGLVRAYSGAMTNALLEAELLEKRDGSIYQIAFAYNMQGKLEHFLENAKIQFLSKDYSEIISAKLLVPKEQEREFLEGIARLSEGSLKPELSENVEFVSSDDKIHIF